jgi:Mrp family chromosome partitioning ATPase
MTRRARLELDQTAALVDRRIAQEQTLTLSVVGAVPAEGVTTVSLGLCGALAAKRGRRVLLLEANGTQPTILKRIRRFGLGADAIATDARLPGELRRAALSPTLTCLAWESPVDEQVQGEFLDEVFVQDSPLLEGVELVVIDLPPVLASADSAVTAGRSHATVYVAAAARQRASVHLDALDQLRLHEAKLIGLVFNRVRDRVPRWLSGRWS